MAGNVTVTVDSSILLQQAIMTHGYLPAGGGSGHLIKPPFSSTDCVGILTQESFQVGKRKFFSRTPAKRRVFLACILLYEERWRIDVYGQANLDRITSLAWKLATEFDIDIDVRLAQEAQKWEYFASDFDF